MATSVAGPLVEMCSTPTYVAPGREYKIYLYIYCPYRIFLYAFEFFYNRFFISSNRNFQIVALAEVAHESSLLRNKILRLTYV